MFYSAALREMEAGNVSLEDYSLGIWGALENIMQMFGGWWKDKHLRIRWLMRWLLRKISQGVRQCCPVKYSVLGKCEAYL